MLGLLWKGNISFPNVAPARGWEVEQPQSHPKGQQWVKATPQRSHPGKAKLSLALAPNPGTSKYLTLDFSLVLCSLNLLILYLTFTPQPPLSPAAFPSLTLPSVIPEHGPVKCPKPGFFPHFLRLVSKLLPSSTPLLPGTHDGKSNQ